MGTAAWHPRVGDRVQVRAVGLLLNCSEMTHYPEEERRTGTVRRNHAQLGSLNHPFLVEFDRPSPRVWILGSEIKLTVGHYAVAELEPFDD